MSLVYFIRHNITNLRLQLSLDSPFHTSQIGYFPNTLRAEVCSSICMLLSMFSGFKSSQCGHKILNAKKGKRNRFVISTIREKTRGFKGAAIDFEGLQRFTCCWESLVRSWSSSVVWATGAHSSQPPCVSCCVSSKAQELFSLVESGIWHPMTGQEAIDPKCRKFH